jgi:uncharacterized protein YegL
MSFDKSKFSTNKSKALPVYLLLDVSSSMAEVVDPENTRATGQTYFKDGKNWQVVEGGTTKMDQLNDAVRKMLVTLTKESKLSSEIQVGVITFGDSASLHQSLTAVTDFQWQSLNCEGMTAMGEAFKMTKALVEDTKVTPSSAYRPLLVLVSDGQPNDSWQAPLKQLIAEGRSAKCDRMAMAIGADADQSVLNQFIEGTGHKLFFAEDASKIHEFFRLVTMSVSVRSRSMNPNLVPLDSDIKLDGPSLQVGGIGKSGDGTPASQPEEEGYW